MSETKYTMSIHLDKRMGPIMDIFVDMVGGDWFDGLKILCKYKEFDKLPPKYKNMIKDIEKNVEIYREEMNNNQRTHLQSIKGSGSFRKVGTRKEERKLNKKWNTKLLKGLKNEN